MRLNTRERLGLEMILNTNGLDYDKHCKASGTENRNKQESDDGKNEANDEHVGILLRRSTWSRLLEYLLDNRSLLKSSSLSAIAFRQEATILLRSNHKRVLPRKRSSFKMSAHVVGQRSFPCKCLSAFVAFAWTMLGMGSFVRSESTALSKRPCTVGALERLESLMNHFVLSQATGNAKSPRASLVGAGERPLPVMRPLVRR